MSLINQMLQELEQRHGSRSEEQALPGQAKAVLRRRRYIQWGAILVVAILLGVAAALSWQLLQRGVGKSSPQPAKVVQLPPPPAPSPPPESPPVPLQPAAAPAPAIPAKEAPVAEAPPSQPAPVEKQVSPPAPGPAMTVAEAPPPKPVPKRAAPAARPKASPAETPPVAASGQKGRQASPLINKQMKEPSPQQRAEEQYRRALVLLQEGGSEEAPPLLLQALQFDPTHAAARLTLAGLWVEQKRYPQAEKLLREGIQLSPTQTEFAVMLARLQVEYGDVSGALETLERLRPHAEASAEYHAFLAAVLQRLGRHKEAIVHYQRALQLAPHSAAWWMGLGISLYAEQRLAEAQEAFRRAKAGNTLSPELLAFVEQRLRQIQQQLR